MEPTRPFNRSHNVAGQVISNSTLQGERATNVAHRMQTIQTAIPPHTTNVTTPLPPPNAITIQTHKTRTNQGQGPNIFPRAPTRTVVVPERTETYIPNAIHVIRYDRSEELSRRGLGIALIIIGIFSAILGGLSAFVDPISGPALFCGLGAGMIGLGIYLLKTSEEAPQRA